MFMLKIRLARIGRKNDPSYRVIITEHARGPQAGKHIEVLGNYNPRTDALSLEGERILHWISKGAQVSDTVHNLLISQKIIEGKKINALPRKSPIVKEGSTPDTKAGNAQAPQAEAERAPAAGDSEAAGVPEKMETPVVDASAREEAPAESGESVPEISGENKEA